MCIYMAAFWPKKNSKCVYMAPFWLPKTPNFFACGGLCKKCVCNIYGTILTQKKTKLFSSAAGCVKNHLLYNVQKFLRYYSVFIFFRLFFFFNLFALKMTLFFLQSFCTKNDLKSDPFFFFNLFALKSDPTFFSIFLN